MSKDEAIHWIMGSVLSVIFGWPILYSFYNKIFWESGIFPSFKWKRDGNRYEALINIAVHLILIGKEDYKAKQQVLQNFLSKEFPGIRGSMSESLSAAISVRLSIKSTVYWLNKATKEPAKKERYVRLMFDLAAKDDSIQRREEAVLIEISRGFKLQDDLVKGWIEDQRRNKAERIFEEQESRKDPVPESKKAYEEILGVGYGASYAEIKRAYRKLVKIHHPDRLHDAGHDKNAFLEIQEAYEKLTANQVK